MPHVVLTGKTRLVTRNVDRGHDHERPQGAEADASRQRQQPDQADREGGHDQDRNEVVDDAGDSQADQGGGSLGEIAGQGRLVPVGEDVGGVDREGVGDRLAGQRAAEREPVADGPRDEDEDCDGGRDGDQAGALQP